MYLVIKARYTPPGSSPIPPVDEEVVDDEGRDNEFLNGRKDAEDLSDEQGSSSWAHAPFWPSVSSFISSQLLSADVSP